VSLKRLRHCLTATGQCPLPSWDAQVGFRLTNMQQPDKGREVCPNTPAGADHSRRNATSHTRLSRPGHRECRNLLVRCRTSGVVRQSRPVSARVTLLYSHSTRARRRECVFVTNVITLLLSRSKLFSVLSAGVILCSPPAVASVTDRATAVAVNNAFNGKQARRCYETHWIIDALITVNKHPVDH